MAEFPEKEDDGDVSPLNMADLKLRLLYGDTGKFSAHMEVIRVIIALGEAASPLLPLVVEQYRGDKLVGVAASSLVELYLLSRHEELLNALREKGAFGVLTVFQQCELLEAGACEFEQDLLNRLWQDWAHVGNVWRVHIAKALGQVGGSKALEMLEVIRYKMAGQIQEEKAKAGGLPIEDTADPDVFLSDVRKLEIGADEEFLNEVRTAVKRMKDRGIK